ncbi:nuclear transport factor 2 [Penicillium riverlandense]|uniref:nuclear transport factor 2 n=1 Tax=Penicillium riverlandense TaxID=1903569 RepID=UPI00254658B0|nr:nuclear transport factor 2 [Penicillium riverlandense]KAJ5818386.1 nuclear transport factor 2 [Penicillium riverlandense]
MSDPLDWYPDPDWADKPEEFIKHYYQVFDVDRAALYKFYRDRSMLSFTFSSDCKGAASITRKLVDLPFRKDVQHKIHAMECQPSNDHGGVLVLVHGALFYNEPRQVVTFTETFQLLPEGDSYFIFNDVFLITHPEAKT